MQEITRQCLAAIPKNERILVWHYDSLNARQLRQVKEFLADRQGGKCDICGISKKEDRLHVDHDHATGRIRGLLCHRCNSMLGLARDDTTILANGVKYLEKDRRRDFEPITQVAFNLGGWKDIDARDAGIVAALESLELPEDEKDFLTDCYGLSKVTWNQSVKLGKIRRQLEKFKSKTRNRPAAESKEPNIHRDRQ